MELSPKKDTASENILKPETNGSQLSTNNTEEKVPSVDSTSCHAKKTLRPRKEISYKETYDEFESKALPPKIAKNILIGKKRKIEKDHDFDM